MKQKEISKLADLFGQKVVEICSFEPYKDPEKSRTDISFSAKNNVSSQFRKDRKSIKDILRNGV